MSIPDCNGVRRVLELALLTGLTARILKTGHPDYLRGFLTCPQGVTVGRAVIQRGEYSHVNWYATPGRELTPYDYWPLSWQCALATGKPLSQATFDKLSAEAQELHLKDYQAKAAWRRANPKAGNRKKLTGRSQVSFMGDLVGELIEQELSEWELKRA